MSIIYNMLAARSHEKHITSQLDHLRSRNFLADIPDTTPLHHGHGRVVGAIKFLKRSSLASASSSKNSSLIPSQEQRYSLQPNQAIRTLTTPDSCTMQPGKCSLYQLYIFHTSETKRQNFILNKLRRKKLV